MLLARASIAVVALIAGGVVTAGACLLALPGRVVSRQMTWDLLFNLEGAWHLRNGHVAHVDFHDPLGALSFALTAVGFHIAGVSPHAFIAGELLATAALFAAALVAVRRRLPLLPAVLFVVFVCQLVLMPVNVGAPIRDFTFAMTYNAIGWSALSVLGLILFLPPHGAGRGWDDLVTAALLLLALFHLKITYFAAAFAALAIALAVSPHLQRQPVRWLVAAGLVLAEVFAPWNAPYRADIAAALATGAAKTGWVTFVTVLFDNVPELSALAFGLVAAVWLWRSGAASLRLPAAVLVLSVLACGMLLQNRQDRGLVLSVVMVLLLYDHFRGSPAPPKGLLLALLVLPAASVLQQAASLVGYAVASGRGAGLLTFDQGTALQGLAVPRSSTGLLDAVHDKPIDFRLFSAIRADGWGQAEVTQFEYAQTLLDAAALFDDPGRRKGTMVVLDQVNPLPFMLRRPPPRGATLWLDPSFPWPTPEQALGAADYVLVPKFPTYGAVTNDALARFGPFIDRHFPVRAENRSWLIYSRR